MTLIAQNLPSITSFDLSNITTIATDLDGTALNAQHQLEPATILALETLVDHGYQVLLATGRASMSVTQIHDQLKHQLPLVTANGAVLSNVSDLVEICHFIPADIVREILALEHDSPLITNVYTKDQWLIDRPELMDFNEEVAKQYQILDTTQLDMSQVVKIFFTDPAGKKNPQYQPTVLQALQQQLVAKFGQQIVCVFSQIYCLEVNAANVSKYATIKEYLALSNKVPEENLISFGDGMNDELMLKGSKYGFVMGTADQALQQAVARDTHITVVGAAPELIVARILNDLFQLGLDLEPYLPRI